MAIDGETGVNKNTDPKTRTVGGVRSAEEMDRAITEITTSLGSLSTAVEELRAVIVGGINNHENREGSNRGGNNHRPHNGGIIGVRERNQTPVNIRRQVQFVESSDDEWDSDQGYVRPQRGRFGDQRYEQFNNPRYYNQRFENPRYGRPQGNNNDGYRVKAEIPNFHGNLDLEAVLDWLYEVDKFFDIMDVPEEQQVKIVAYKLRGGAGAWWENEQDNRRRQGRRPVTEWQRMKRMIKGRFLPPDYEQILYQQYHNCIQGKRPIIEYPSEFLRLQARCNLKETEE